MAILCAVIGVGVVLGVLLATALVGLVVLAFVIDRTRTSAIRKRSRTTANPLDPTATKTLHNPVAEQDDGRIEEPLYHQVTRTTDLSATPLGHPTQPSEQHNAYLYVADDRLLVNNAHLTKSDSHRGNGSSSLGHWSTGSLVKSKHQAYRKSSSLGKHGVGKPKPWSFKGAVQVIFPGMLKGLPSELEQTLLQTECNEVESHKASGNPKELESNGFEDGDVQRETESSDCVGTTFPAGQNPIITLTHYEMSNELLHPRLHDAPTSTTQSRTVSRPTPIASHSRRQMELHPDKLDTSHQTVVPDSLYASVELTGSEYAAPVRMSLSHVVDTPRQSLESSQQTTEYSYVPSQKARTSGIHERLVLEIKQSLLDLTKGHVKVEAQPQPFTPPAAQPEQLYDQLARTKCLEIPTHSIVMLDRCGSGYFGDVFKGVWETPYGPRDVAVKTLKPGASKEQMIKFLQEVTLMAQFKHPNIVCVLGAVTVTEPHFIVLEFLHNGDLLKYLSAQKKIMQLKKGTHLAFAKQLLRFCREIADGMQYLSSRGFVHRDLAARNILLSNTFECKIADFGMSKRLSDDEYYMSSGGRIPVKWTAPEALLFKKYGVWGDIWSFGMVMFEIWSLGEKPFPDMTVNEVVVTLAKRSAYVQQPPPGCPPALYRIMVLCWNHTYRSRPSFGEIATMLYERSELILDIPKAALQGVSNPTEAVLLGAPLECSQDLYLDLQHFYHDTKP